MSPFLKRYKYHFLLVLAGLLWLFFLDSTLQLTGQYIIYPDSDNYLEAARNLYVFHRGHPYRPVLLALLSGLPYLFGGGDSAVFQWVFILNIFCWISTGILVFEMVRSFAKDKTAFLTALCYVFCIGIAVNLFHFLAENIFLFFLMLFVFLMQKFGSEKKFLWLSLALSVLILSMLIKPVTTYIAIILVLYYIKVLAANFTKKAMLFVYFSLAAVMVQVVGIKHQFGDYTISYIDAVTYHNYICSKADCFLKGKTYSQENNPRAEYLFQFEPKVQKKIAVADLKQQLSSNKINLVKAYFADAFENTSHGCYAVQDCRNVNKTGYFDFFRKLFFALSKYQNRILSISGFLLALYFALRDFRKPDYLTFSAFLVLYIIGVSGISSGQGDRFHIVVFPFVLMLWAKFLTERNWLKPRAVRPQK